MTFTCLFPDQLLHSRQPCLYRSFRSPKKSRELQQIQKELSSISTLYDLKWNNTSHFIDMYGRIRWIYPQRHIFLRTFSKRVREGLITDGTFSIPIYVWEDHIDKISENALYKVQNVKSKRSKNGPKFLSTTGLTTVVVVPLLTLCCIRRCWLSLTWP